MLFVPKGKAWWKILSLVAVLTPWYSIFPGLPLQAASTLRLGLMIFVLLGVSSALVDFGLSSVGAEGPILKACNAAVLLGKLLNLAPGKPAT